MKKIIFFVFIASVVVYLFTNRSFLEQNNDIEHAHSLWLSKAVKIHPELVRQDFLMDDGSPVTFGSKIVEPVEVYNSIQELLSIEEVGSFFRLNKKEASIYFYNKYKNKEDACVVYPAILDKVNNYNIYNDPWRRDDDYKCIIKKIKRDYNVE